jgi:hypothetical protein
MCFLSASVGGLWPAPGRNLTERVVPASIFRGGEGKFREIASNRRPLGIKVPTPRS